MVFRAQQIIKEIQIKAVRSRGPGGQNVNKLNTKVELRFNVQNSNILTDNEKIKVCKYCSKIINREGYLILTEQSSRSQLSNKKNVINKFLRLIDLSLKTNKRRIKTKPTNNSIENRLENKKRQSEKKEMRRWKDG